MSAPPAPTRSSWRQNSVDVLFVATEAVAWFMAIRVIASITERTFFEDLEQRLRFAMQAGQIEPGPAESALQTVRAAAESASGPNFFLVLAVGLGAFGLIRGIAAMRLDGPLGAVVLLLGSVVALNVALRLALAGDLRVWDVGGFAQFLTDPDPYFAARLDLQAFVADPTVRGEHGGTLAVTFIGMVLMWLRFVLAGRNLVTFDRVLTSFTVSFIVVLLMMMVARFAGVETVARYAVAHFVFGVLGLAIANNARAAVPTEGDRRTAPWVMSVGGTVGVLLSIALLLGLLAFLNVGVVLAAIGNIALAIVEIVLIIVITPIYWVIDAIVRFFFPDGITGGLDRLQEFEAIPEDVREQMRGDGLDVPAFITDGLRFLAVVVLGYIVYRVAQAIVARRRALTSLVDEVRTSRSGGAGLGEIFRDLFPKGGRRVIGGEWLRRQPIYRLYGRVVVDSHERGFRMMEGETPIEFSGRAARSLAAPFEAVGQAFDRARYGRHYPTDEEVRSMEAEVARWEREVPPSDELRERLAGATPLSDSAQYELRVRQARLVARGQLEEARRIDPDR